MSMLTQKRHEEILKILNERGTVSVSDLTRELDSSESTIRRDLIALDKLGKLTKVHGGATQTGHQFLNYEPDFEDKIQEHVEEKYRIAEYAASQIQDGDFVYLDAGTTTFLMIDYLTSKNIEVVTNGIAHAQQLAKRGFKAYILGGELKASTQAVVGLAAAQNLTKYNFSKAFLGTNGIDLRRGFTTPDPDEAFLKSAAVEQAFVSYVVADSSKFDRVSTVTFAPLSTSAIITDAEPANEAFGAQTVVKVIGREGT